jgi:hypothetical protein
MLILNEEKYAKTVYNGDNQDVKSIMPKIRYVTRYLWHVEHKSDEEIYKETVEWLVKYHSAFDESCYSNLISDAIAAAHKYPFYNIPSIKITQLELDIISSLDNLRAEKVLFVLLCMAKQQSVSVGFTNGLVKYSITDLCKMARVSVPADEREYILHTIVQHGLISCPKKNDTKCLIVNFIDNEGDAALELDETECQELAYVYLSWKNNGVGYGRCECCHRMMKKAKTNPKRFCEQCEQVIGDVPDDTKVIMCVDCNKPVFISIFDSATCRCNECQSQNDKRMTRERVQKHREKIKCNATL